MHSVFAGQQKAMSMASVCYSPSRLLSEAGDQVERTGQDARSRGQLPIVYESIINIIISKQTLVSYKRNTCSPL